MVKHNKPKKGEIPTEVGPERKPAKKSRASELGEEKESPPRRVQSEPKVFLCFVSQMVKQNSKSKKEASPTGVGLATNPAKKARGASELVKFCNILKQVSDYLAEGRNLIIQNYDASLTESEAAA